LKCDRWASLSADEILSKVNNLLDSIGKLTNQEPLLYTSAVWWRGRIGGAEKADQLHTKLVWTADYSKSGLAKESPRTIGKGWDLWQFSESAVVAGQPGKVLMDASIFEGDQASMRERLHIKK